LPIDDGLPLVLTARENGVLTLTLNQPQNRNALSSAMMVALQQALDDAAANPASRVIVIAGNGPAFCAGHDLKELSGSKRHADGGRAFLTTLMQQCSKLMQTIVFHSKPVIADVRGIATAAGCQLVASCDLAIASNDSRFATPGVNIGLFCSTPMVALSRKVGRKQSMEMLLTGDMIDAEKAREIGLVNQVHAPVDMDGVVAALTAKIASKSMMTLRTGKQAFYRQLDMPLDAAYAFTVDVMIDNMLKADAREGVAAFLEKRPAVWRDQ
jgi:enoyl-CoA hydratase/carnithine racemase